MSDQAFALFLQNPRILMIDDDRDYVELSAEIMRDHGAEVQIAYDGSQGLVIAKSFDPDLIISDLTMPIMKGDALLAELRRTHYEKPFILLTGMSELSAVTAALRNHAFDYLVKPVSPQILTAAASNALRSEYERLVTKEELEQLYSALNELAPEEAWEETIRKKAAARVRENREARQQKP